MILLGYAAALVLLLILAWHLFGIATSLQALFEGVCHED